MKKNAFFKIFNLILASGFILTGFNSKSAEKPAVADGLVGEKFECAVFSTGSVGSSYDSYSERSDSYAFPVSEREFVFDDYYYFYPSIETETFKTSYSNSLGCEAISPGGYFKFNLGNYFAGTSIDSIDFLFKGSYYTFTIYCNVKVNDTIIFEEGTIDEPAYLYDFGYHGWNYGYGETSKVMGDLGHILTLNENVTVTFGVVENTYGQGSPENIQVDIDGIRIHYTNYGGSYVRESYTDSSLSVSYNEDSNEKADHYYQRVESISELNDGDKVVFVAGSGLDDEHYYTVMDQFLDINYPNRPASFDVMKESSEKNIYNGKYLNCHIFDKYLYQIETSNYGFLIKNILLNEYLLSDNHDDDSHICFGRKEEDLHDGSAKCFWNISFDSASYLSTIKNVCTEANQYLGFESSSGTFDCFSSITDDERVYIYKLVNLSISNVGLRFRLKIAADKFEQLNNNEAIFGVAACKGTLDSIDSSSNQWIIDPVRVDSNGKESKTGEFYQFALVVNNIPQSEWKTTISAKPFVKLGDDYFFANGASYSVYDIAKTYLTNYPNDEVVKNNYFVLNQIVEACEVK